MEIKHVREKECGLRMGCQIKKISNIIKNVKNLWKIKKQKDDLYEKHWHKGQNVKHREEKLKGELKEKRRGERRRKRRRERQEKRQEKRLGERLGERQEKRLGERRGEKHREGILFQFEVY